MSKTGVSKMYDEYIMCYPRANAKVTNTKQWGMLVDGIYGEPKTLWLKISDLKLETQKDGQKFERIFKFTQK